MESVNNYSASIPKRYQDSLSDPYPVLRSILHESYSDLSPYELEETLEPMMDGVSLEEYEDILRSLSRFGKQAGNVLSKAAPGMLSGAAAGATTGAALGPYGALIGGALGAIGGGVQSYQASQQRRPSRPPVPRPAPRRPLPQAPIPRAPIPNLASRQTMPSQNAQMPPAVQRQNPAAAQLVGVLTRPGTLQALLSMVMGQTGRRNVQIGNTQVPVAAITNLISVLAQRAAAQQNGVVSRENVEEPEYLLDDVGEYICNPLDSNERADVLLRLIEGEIYEDEKLHHEQAALREDDYEDEILQEIMDDIVLEQFDADNDEEWEEELNELLG